jgi:hypothetical protein
VPHRKPFGKPDEAVRFRAPLSASDWARPDPADSIDTPSADQPAILPNWRLENRLKGIVSLTAPGSINLEQNKVHS